MWSYTFVIRLSGQSRKFPVKPCVLQLLSSLRRTITEATNVLLARLVRWVSTLAHSLNNCHPLLLGTCCTEIRGKVFRHSEWLTKDRCLLSQPWRQILRVLFLHRTAILFLRPLLVFVPPIYPEKLPPLVASGRGSVRYILV